MDVNVFYLRFSLRMARRSLFSRKVRTFLTVMAVVWSVATLVALYTVGYGIRISVSEQVDRIMQAEIIIREGSITIPREVVGVLRKIHGVKEVAGVTLVFGNYKGKVFNLAGVSVEELGFFKPRLVRGRSLSSNYAAEIIVDTNLAKHFGLKPGDHIRIKIAFGTVEKEVEVQVVGVSEALTIFTTSPEASLAAIPIGFLSEKLGTEGFYNYVFIRLENRDLMDKVSENIKSIFPGVNVFKQTELLKSISRIMDIVTGMLLAVTVIGLAVAALGVMNTMYMNVHERIREIGIMKAIGATRRDVALVFILETILLGASGGLLGDLAGYFGSFIVAEFIKNLGLKFSIPIIFLPDVMAMGFIVAISVSVLSSLYPIWRAASIPPVEALKVL